MVSHDAEFYVSASESLKERKGHQIIFYIGETNYYFTLSMKAVGLGWMDFFILSFIFLSIWETVKVWQS